MSGRPKSPRLVPSSRLCRTIQNEQSCSGSCERPCLLSILFPCRAILHCPSQHICGGLRKNLLYTRTIGSGNLPGPCSAVLFILNSPAICRRINVKLVKLETFFFFTIITTNNATMRRQCNSMPYNGVVSRQRLRLPTRSGEDGRLPEPLACLYTAPSHVSLLFQSFSFRGEHCQTR